MASILNVGVSALLAYQRSLNTTGHNIANVNTPGYSRQRVEFGTQIPELTGAGWLGSGVKVTQIQRVYDNFLAVQMRSSQSVASELDTYLKEAQRIDNLLADVNVGLDPALQGFFDSLQGLADEPSLVPARHLTLAESRALVDRFHDLDRRFQAARDRLNQELGIVAGEINNIAESVALINQNIVQATGAAAGDPPNDLLDQREVLLHELSKLVDIATVPQDDGAVNVFIGKGQALVIGSSAATLNTAPSAADVRENDVVLVNTTGSQVITSQLSGGELGGLLAYRGQVLDPAQNRLGLVAVGLIEDVNAQHQLGLDLNGNFGGQFFNYTTIQILPNSNNGGAGGVTATFVDANNLTASDYELRYDGADQYTLTRLSDNSTTVINTGGTSPYTTAEIDGFDLTITAGANAGDTFLVRPTRTAADEIGLLINDVRELAAAGPVRVQETTDTDGNSTNTGSGAVTQPDVVNNSNLPLAGPITLTFDPNAFGLGVPGFNVAGGPAGPLAYDPSTESGGKTFTFPTYGGMSFTITGDPASGDSFVISNNTGGVGDNRNALALAGLQSQRNLLGGTASFQGTYSQLVSDVGSRTHQAEVNLQAQEGLLERNQNELSAVSGVNLDEEAANLVKLQQMYQAAAQVITVANTLFDSLISAVRR